MLHTEKVKKTMAEIGIRLDTRYLAPDAPAAMVTDRQDDVSHAHKMLLERTGMGADFLGWFVPADLANKDLISDVQEAANELRKTSDALVVIGIGGSYLGARAVIEALADDEANHVFFAGNNLSADYHTRLLKRLEGKRVAVNVISKSGTTTEPAIAFRIFREFLERTQGIERARRLIIATTDESKGALLNLAVNEGYRRFVVPNDVGGRFSVLSPVGLLPIAYTGVDINQLVAGAGECAQKCTSTDLTRNPVYYYAAARNTLYRKGFRVEMLSHFEPRLHFMAEWWKQLFGESEGKDNKGLFPASLDLTADLHSMGQYAQDGLRTLIETFLIVETGETALVIPAENQDMDGMNYLAGCDMGQVNREAYRATALAHREGGVPNMTVALDRLDARHMGALIYFFERACAVSGYLLEVNPFNQPGVEAYKKHMFALLGKPGLEEKTKEIRRRVEETPDNSTIISFGQQR